MNPLDHRLFRFTNRLSALNLKLLPQCILLNHMHTYSNWPVMSQVQSLSRAREP